MAGLVAANVLSVPVYFHGPDSYIIPLDDGAEDWRTTSRCGSEGRRRVRQD